MKVAYVFLVNTRLIFKIGVKVYKVRIFVIYMNLSINIY